MLSLQSSLLKLMTRGIAASLLLALVSACAPESQPEAGLPSPSSSSTVSSLPNSAKSQSSNPQSSNSQDSSDAPPAGGANSAAQPPTKSSANTPIAGGPSSQPVPSQPESEEAIALIKPTFWSKERMAGFSTDGRHFLYLESSRDTGAGIPKSRLQVVNVAANACQPEACIATRYGESDANLPTQTAEESLLKQTWQVRQTLQLTPPVSGAELSIVARSRQPNGTELVTVRLKDGDSLQLQLQQKRIASIHHGGTAVRDRAAMQLQVSRGGQSRLIGSLNDFRDDVLDYSIRGVKLSPDGKRVAILLTATTPTFEGTLATTLVQGAEL